MRPMSMRLAAPAMLGAMLGALSGGPAMASAIPQVTVNGPARRKKGLFNGRVEPDQPMLYGTRSAKGTTAQQKRASIKAKNRARNKGAHRG